MKEPYFYDDNGTDDGVINFLIEKLPKDGSDFYFEISTSNFAVSIELRKGRNGEYLSGVRFSVIAMPKNIFVKDQVDGFGFVQKAFRYQFSEGFFVKLLKAIKKENPHFLFSKNAENVYYFVRTGLKSFLDLTFNDNWSESNFGLLDEFRLLKI